MGIEKAVKETAENLVYDIFEIDDELMEIEITGVEIDFDAGAVIEGRISEVLEDEYGHYDVSVNTDSLVNAFSNYDETVLIDYML